MDAMCEWMQYKSEILDCGQELQKTESKADCVKEYMLTQKNVCPEKYELYRDGMLARRRCGQGTTCLYPHIECRFESDLESFKYNHLLSVVRGSSASRVCKLGARTV